jgi:hypothetical protein
MGKKKSYTRYVRLTHSLRSDGGGVEGGASVVDGGLIGQGWSKGGQGDDGAGEGSCHPSIATWLAH